MQLSGSLIIKNWSKGLLCLNEKWTRRYDKLNDIMTRIKVKHRSDDMIDSLANRVK